MVKDIKPLLSILGIKPKIIFIIIIQFLVFGAGKYFLKDIQNTLYKLDKSIAETIAFHFWEVTYVMIFSAVFGAVFSLFFIITSHRKAIFLYLASLSYRVFFISLSLKVLLNFILIAYSIQLHKILPDLLIKYSHPILMNLYSGLLGLLGWIGSGIIGSFAWKLIEPKLHKIDFFKKMLENKN